MEESTLSALEECTLSAVEEDTLSAVDKSTLSAVEEGNLEDHLLSTEEQVTSAATTPEEETTVQSLGLSHNPSQEGLSFNYYMYVMFNVCFIW